MIEVVLIVVAGFCAGTVSGLMGVGGGILFVPALVLLFDKTQVEAEATSLLAIIPVALIGTWRQHRYGNVNLRDGLWIGLLSPVGVALGVVAANELPERTLKIGFALLSLAIAAQLVRRALREPGRPPDPKPEGH